jgi:hypothetical protein
MSKARKRVLAPHESEEVKTAEIEELEDHDFSLDAYFFHDYWMRVFSILYAPTFLMVFIQLNFVGSRVEEIMGFAVAMLVVIMMICFVGYSAFRAAVFYLKKLSPNFCQFYKEDTVAVASSNVFYFTLDLLRKTIFVCMVVVNDKDNGYLVQLVVTCIIGVMVSLLFIIYPL